MQNKKESDTLYPMLKTVEQMSKISGIGANKLRELMDKRELEYVQNGNRRLIADSAIWKWYEDAKIPVLKEGYGKEELNGYFCKTSK